MACRSGEAYRHRLPLPRKSCASARQKALAVGANGTSRWDDVVMGGHKRCGLAAVIAHALGRWRRDPRYKGCTWKGTASSVCEAGAALGSRPFSLHASNPPTHLSPPSATTPSYPNTSCDGGYYDKSYTQRSQPRSVWPIRLVGAQEPVGAIVVPESNFRPPRKPHAASRGFPQRPSGAIAESSRQQRAPRTAQP